MNRMSWHVAIWALAVTIGGGGCSSSVLRGDAAADASGGGGQGGGTGGTDAGEDTSSDATRVCSYPDGGAPTDGGTFGSACPASGCPTGTVCVSEVGGVAGGGGEYCAPIPNECHGTPTCGCMASCVCTNGFAGRPETCTVENGTIACDNGIR